MSQVLKRIKRLLRYQTNIFFTVFMLFGCSFDMLRYIHHANHVPFRVSCRYARLCCVMLIITPLASYSELTSSHFTMLFHGGLHPCANVCLLQLSRTTVARHVYSPPCFFMGDSSLRERMSATTFSNHCCPSCLSPGSVVAVITNRVPGVTFMHFLPPSVFHSVIAWPPAPHDGNATALVVKLQGPALIAAVRNGDVGKVEILATPDVIEHNEVPSPPKPNPPYFSAIVSSPLFRPPTSSPLSRLAALCLSPPLPPSPPLSFARVAPPMVSPRLPCGCAVCTCAVGRSARLCVPQDGTALVWAVRMNQTPVARLLLDRGARVDATDDVRGCQPTRAAWHMMPRF